MPVNALSPLLSLEIGALNALARSEEMEALETNALAARSGVTRATAARWFGEQANPRNLVPLSLAGMRPDATEELIGRNYATRLSAAILFNGGYEREVEYDGDLKSFDLRFATLAAASAIALNVIEGVYEAWLALSWTAILCARGEDEVWTLTVSYKALNRLNYADAAAELAQQRLERDEFIESFEGELDE